MKFYGSGKCSDCLAAAERLKNAGAVYEFKDITESLESLKEFLSLRDREDKFLDKRKCGEIGIPCFLLDDGSVTFDIERVMGIYTSSRTQSVTGVLIKDGCVLLGRHTYGAGKGKLIVPGGYITVGETPEAAVVREYMEETGVRVIPKSIIGIRFNNRDWYAAFLLEYAGGDARSDHEENSEVVWLPVEEALSRDDVPELTKYLIRAALSKNDALHLTDFNSSSEKRGIPTLYART